MGRKRVLPRLANLARLPFFFPWLNFPIKACCESRREARSKVKVTNPSIIRSVYQGQAQITTIGGRARLFLHICVGTPARVSARDIVTISSQLRIHWMERFRFDNLQGFCAMQSLR